MKWLLVIAALAGCGRLSFDERSDASVVAVGDDAAEDGPLAANIVFVTSQAVIPGQLGGIAGADAACDQDARMAGLPGTYVAWLSTSTTSAASRLGTARGWVRTDGLPFADQVADIVAGRIWYPPRKDELQQEFKGIAVTATQPNGTLEGNGSCQDYTDTSGSVRVGNPSSGTDQWTDELTTSCGGQLYLYCFGIDHTTTVTVAPSTAKRAFLSQPIVPGGGRAALNSQCRSDAMAAGLGMNFAALVATTTASARESFTPQTFRRLDNVIVTNDLLSLGAPIAVRASGSYASANVWSGAGNPTQLAAALNCSDWATNTAGQDGAIGDSANSGSYWFSYGTGSCNSPLSVYCFEQ